LTCGDPGAKLWRIGNYRTMGLNGKENQSMSKGTGGQGGGGKKKKKNRAGKPAAPKPTSSSSGPGANPIADGVRDMQSQTPYNRANAAGIPRRTSG
jgi:hypothetical protein